jgi:formate--tetrahydrofolate ligase
VVAINEFITDTEAEFLQLEALCQQENVIIRRASVWANGGLGGKDLAEAVVDAIETKEANYQRLYEDSLSIEEKVKTIVSKIYGGKDVSFGAKAQTQLKTFAQQGWDNLPVCMAKTQYSFSDNPTLLGAPTDFTVTIREFVPKLGAGFIVALTGDVMTMPGLPKQPAALNMDIDEKGRAIGLF